MSLRVRRKEVDRKYRQARNELKIVQDRLKFRANEWVKATRRQHGLPRSFTFSIPLAGDVLTEEKNLQILSEKFNVTPVSVTQEEIIFRKNRLPDLSNLMEVQNHIANLEKQLMHLGDPVRDVGGYKVRQKFLSAAIFKRGNRRRIVQIIVVVGCIALGLYGLSFLIPPVVKWGDTVRVDFTIYTPELLVLEKSPSGGSVYTLIEDMEPELFFEGIVGRPVGANFWVDIPVCDSQNCSNYGGFTKGSFAWRELRINVTILEILLRSP